MYMIHKMYVQYFAQKLLLKSRSPAYGSKNIDTMPLKKYTYFIRFFKIA